MFVHFKCAREKGDANPIECTAHNKHKCWLTMLHALKKKKENSYFKSVFASRTYQEKNTNKQFLWAFAHFRQQQPISNCP